MRNFVLCFLGMILFVSCGIRTPYDTFRDDHREEVVFSLGASKVLAHMFMDNDDLAEFKEIVDGVSKYTILVFDGNSGNLQKSFNDFTSKKGYEKLFYLKSDGTAVDLYTYNRSGKLREVIFKVNDGKDDMVIISAEGKNIKIGNVQKGLNKLAGN